MHNIFGHRSKNIHQQRRRARHGCGNVGIRRADRAAAPPRAAGEAGCAAMPSEEKAGGFLRKRREMAENKKGQIFRSDLEEAATYSPTGKPQYHRRE